MDRPKERDLVVVAMEDICPSCMAKIKSAQGTGVEVTLCQSCSNDVATKAIVRGDRLRSFIYAALKGTAE